jgi:hypothetical protein
VVVADVLQRRCDGLDKVGLGDRGHGSVSLWIGGAADYLRPKAARRTCARGRGMRRMPTCCSASSEETPQKFVKRLLNAVSYDAGLRLALGGVQPGQANNFTQIARP